MDKFLISCIRSVELGVTDIASAEAFYTSVWGLELIAREGDKVFLAATGDDICVLELRASHRTELRKTTFRAASDEAFAELHRRVSASGAVMLRDIEPVSGPCGGTHFVFREPQGTVIEIVIGDMRKAATSDRTRAYRLSHVNFNSTNVADLVDFYRDVLGFDLTDRSGMMAFLRCNSDHHAVVLADADVNGLNHIAFMMPDWEGVMLGAGRMRDNGYEIGWGVGRHGPGDNVFAYFVAPDGAVIEYTAEVLQVDESYRVGSPKDWTWPAGRTDQWGIAPAKSDACKAAQLTLTFDEARK
ncbi:VOC family protein [Pseudooceanicola spongiae]|uniref:Glyoxalase n=1 Tax=Pseudooceanicola spongiae TaxID=2613965 RepID=A0A7L9WVA4_9RHOB|nr:VOC family protein [Pseudooceanicola spongiae]QOL83010.1 glyoxalase [Pseudooceanicola spongiae]